MNFRKNNPSESRIVEKLFSSVFTDSEGEAEGLLIGNLVNKLIAETPENDLHIFVAADENQLVGAIIFSRMPTKAESEIFILAPVAVRTTYQGKGVGKSLIQYGVKELKERCAKILVTYGDPNFYSKVGFSPIDEKLISPPHKLSQPEGWLAQSLDGSVIDHSYGKSSCASAWNDPAYW